MDLASHKRKLAAVLAADVVDYSRHMGADEDATMEQWWRHRREVIDPLVGEFEGRIVKHTGDGFLAEFASALDAVRCALAMQVGITEGGAEVAAERRIKFRMGVNLGDIMSDDEDIYGDGVNIAARIEALAEPGGVMISGSVYQQIRSKPGFRCDDRGEQRLKNIAEPVRIYAISTTQAAADPVPLTTVEEEEDAEDVPSVAVLPFDNMSGDPEQEYFADGITEDLITDLSKISGLLVIARNSVFTYKGKPIIVPDVCRELGVRWALEGSVRKSGNRVRINAQLIDGATGGHLWAERYDHNLDDIFAVQDEVAAEIVDALKVRVSRQEQSRLKRHGKVDMLIYDASLRAREKMWLSSAQATSEALEMFSEVVDKNPNNTACLALRAILTSIQFTNQWSDDPERSLENAVADAEKAISLDPNEFTAHWALGMVRHWQGRMEESRVASGRMIELAPGRPEGHALISSIEHYTGNPDAALEHANTAIKVDPFGPSMFVQMKGQAEFMLGDFEAAEVTLNKRIERSPETDTSRLYLASLYGHRGEVDAAREMWNEIFQVNPDYSLAKRLEVWPYSDDALPHRILEGLEKAGIDHQIEL